MADNELFNPSICVINEARIFSDGGSSFSIIDLITEVFLSQSIDSVSLNGHLRLLDTVGLMEDFPIRGEERLTLEIESGDGLNTVKRLDLQIYKVDNITITDANDGLGYLLHFVTRMTYEASIRKIIEPHDGKISSTVANIFSRYFSKLTPKFDNLAFNAQNYTTADDRFFYVQPTDGSFKCVIPNYMPSETMYFLASRSYSSNSPSCAFRFFENINGYFFVTDEFLIKNAIEKNNVYQFTYNAVTSNDASRILEQILNIETLENPKRVNTAEDMLSGAYTSNVIEVDLLKKKVTNLRYNYSRDAKYIDMSGDRKKIDASIHTESFISKTFTQENEKRYLLFKDYRGVGDLSGELRGELFISKIVPNRVSYLHHLNNTVLNATIKGRLDIAAGDIVNMQITEFNFRDRREENKQLSGKYIVHSINHHLVGEKMNTNMKLVKFGWSK